LQVRVLPGAPQIRLNAKVCRFRAFLDIAECAADARVVMPTLSIVRFQAGSRSIFDHCDVEYGIL
jgi:hypothetical protein